jgi:eukaryotic-like serine/threonine-protein kinase
MGKVYKAIDRRLGRPVALKFLPNEVTRDRHALERFQREARTASSLNHPHICTIYDIDEAEGWPFIAMELLEGETLRDRIQGQPLKIQEIVDLGIQLADALDAAHAKGILHRDIKPENIFVTSRGTAKLLDFGIAKLAAEQVSVTVPTATLTEWVTMPGVAVGTVAYMSPEQVCGEMLDARTDLFSLGVVLYETATGSQPFRGATTGAVCIEIQTKTPTAPVRLNPNVPAELEQIINKALEKDVRLRYHSAKDMLVDLERLRRNLASSPRAAARSTAEQTSIVVLPFENLSPDPEQEYFCDGMTEEIITDLSHVHDLLVISRSSAMTFKGTKKTIPEIARAVNVRYVLEGSVRKAGSNLRITAQLIDAANDAHLWAEKYSGTLNDVFDIQEKVSRSIVDALKLQLTPEEAKRLVDRPIPDALTYEFYLKARQEILKWTEAGLENALRYLQNGLAIVGENALLNAGMAYVYCQYFNLGIKEEEYCRKEAEGYLNKAFALDPRTSYGHFVQGLLLAPDNPREAIRHFKRALETNPNDFDTLFFLSCALGTLGQRRAVLLLEERTIQIDPLNPAAHFHSGFNRLWEGEYPLALEVLRKLHQSFPGDLLTKWSYGLSLAYMDKKDEAGSIFDQIVREQPGTIFAGLGLAMKYALEGRKSDALRCLDSNPQLQKTRDFQYAYWIVECYALIDEKERALDWLERDVNLGMINYPLLDRLDPFLENIRGEERFKKLMLRVKHEWEHFEV